MRSRFSLCSLSPSSPSSSLPLSLLLLLLLLLLFLRSAAALFFIANGIIRFIVDVKNMFEILLNGCLFGFVLVKI